MRCVRSLALLSCCIAAAPSSSAESLTLAQSKDQRSLNAIAFHNSQGICSVTNEVVSITFESGWRGFLTLSVDWGDGNNNQYGMNVKSSKNYTVDHIFEKEGEFEVKADAQVKALNSKGNQWDTINESISLQVTVRDDGCNAVMPNPGPTPAPTPSPMPSPTPAPTLAVPMMNQRSSMTDDNIRSAVNLWLEDPEAARLQYGPIEQWNTTQVRDMSSLFYGADDFNADLSSWDTSAVEAMNRMFWGASAFNQTLCWTVSSRDPFLPPAVKGMFCGSGGSFNTSCVDADIIEAATLCPTVPPSSAPTAKILEPINDEDIRDAVSLWLSDPAEATDTYGHISDWDVSNVTDFSSLFEGKSTFNDDISGWQTSSAIKMDDMFRGCAGFNGNLAGFDTSNVISVERMFDGCYSFVGNGLEGWQTGKVESFFAMFHLAHSFNGNIGGWNVSSCVDFSYMFMGSALNRDLSLWDVSSGTSFSWMFHKAIAYNGKVANWNMSTHAIDMEGMFFGAEAFNRTLCWDLPSGTVTKQTFCNSGGGFNSSCVGDALAESARDCPMSTSAGAVTTNMAVMLSVLTAVMWLSL